MTFARHIWISSVHTSTCSDAMCLFLAKGRHFYMNYIKTEFPSFEENKTKVNSFLLDQHLNFSCLLALLAMAPFLKFQNLITQYRGVGAFYARVPCLRLRENGDTNASRKRSISPEVLNLHIRDVVTPRWLRRENGGQVFALFWSFIEFGAIGREGYSLIKVFIDLSSILFALFKFI